MTDINLEGAGIIIVGGSSGMGLALARRLLAEGARVTIAGRSAARLEAARQTLGDPADLNMAALDLTREEEIAAFFRDCGPVDHIVSTAADIEGAYQLLPDAACGGAAGRREQILRAAAACQIRRAVPAAVWLDHLYVGGCRLSAGGARFRRCGRQCGAGGTGAGARGRACASARQRRVTGLGGYANLEFRCRRCQAGNAGGHGEAAACGSRRSA